jgi:hypothetical protein
MSTAAEIRTKFPWLVYWLLLAVIVIVAVAPMASAYYAETLAQANNCRLTDSGADGPCLGKNGEDLGPLIGDLMAYAWMMILTLPAGFVAALVWLVALVVHRTLWRRRRENRA